MARQNPLSELDRLIGQRLRQYRIKRTGLSAVEFARRAEIDSNRLATYEHGRAPLPFEVANTIARAFNLNLRWIVEGIEPVNYFISIPKQLTERMPHRATLSSAYNNFLSSHFAKHFNELSALWGGKIDPAGLEVMQQMGRAALSGVSEVDLMSFLNRHFSEVVAKLPPDLYQQFYQETVQASRLFEKQNEPRISEWIAAPKTINPPAWMEKAAESSLTNDSLKSKSYGVKSELEKLIARVKRLADKPGAKSELARLLKVAPARITEWLNDDPKMRKEPGGNYTLQLLHWVEQQERQK